MKAIIEFSVKDYEGLRKGEDEPLLIYLRERFKGSPQFTACVQQVAVDVMKKMGMTREMYMRKMAEWWDGEP